MVEVQRKQSFSPPSHIMVVDDDLVALESFVDYIGGRGYEVSSVENNAKTLETFLELIPDVVFCNLNKSYKNTLTLIKQFYSHMPQIPIIVISESSRIKNIIEALRIGATDYLITPILDLEGLDTTIDSALLKKHLDNQNYSTCALEDLELDSHLNALDSNLKLGRETQELLLPSPERKISNYHFQYCMEHNNTENGHSVDYFEIDKNNLGFYMADLTGHDDNVALASMLLKSFINHALRQYITKGINTICNPSVLLSYLNKEMININIGKYTTIYYGVINTKLNILTYSLGGYYPKPVLLNDDKLVTFNEDGFPIGLFKWAEYKQHTIELKPNSTLAIFSDAVFSILADKKLISTHDWITYSRLKKNISADKIIKLLKQKFSSDNPLADLSLFLVQRKE